MLIAGLDLSLTSTGWAVGETDDEGGLDVTHGLIKPRTTGMPRLADIQASVWDVVEGVDLVVIEEYAYSANAAHAHEIGEVGGVIRFTLHKRGKTWVPVIPSSLKKYATGKGNAPKPAVMADAIRRLGYEGNNYDEADALWLLFMALDHYGASPIQMPAAHRIGLEKVPWPSLEAAA